MPEVFLFEKFNSENKYYYLTDKKNIIASEEKYDYIRIDDEQYLFSGILWDYSSGIEITFYLYKS